MEVAAQLLETVLRFVSFPGQVVAALRLEENSSTEERIALF
jgi:hypothetical protein